MYLDAARGNLLLGASVTPLNQPSAALEHSSRPPSSSIARCASCHAYINRYCTFDNVWHACMLTMKPKRATAEENMVMQHLSGGQSDGLEDDLIACLARAG